MHRSAAIERLETNISNIPRQDVLSTANMNIYIYRERGIGVSWCIMQEK